MKQKYSRLRRRAKQRHNQIDFIVTLWRLFTRSQINKIKFHS